MLWKMHLKNVRALAIIRKIYQRFTQWKIIESVLCLLVNLMIIYLMIFRRMWVDGCWGSSIHAVHIRINGYTKRCFTYHSRIHAVSRLVVFFIGNMCIDSRNRACSISVYIRACCFILWILDMQPPLSSIRSIIKKRTYIGVLLI